jgi:hypothetical protein
VLWNRHGHRHIDGFDHGAPVTGRWREDRYPILHAFMYHIHLLLFVLLFATAHAQTTNITVQGEPCKRLSYGAFYKSLVIKTDLPGPEHITGFAFTSRAIARRCRGGLE